MRRKYARTISAYKPMNNRVYPPILQQFLTQINHHSDENNQSKEVVEGRGEEYDGDYDISLRKKIISVHSKSICENLPMWGQCWRWCKRGVRWLRRSLGPWRGAPRPSCGPGANGGSGCASERIIQPAKRKVCHYEAGTISTSQYYRSDERTRLNRQL